MSLYSKDVVKIVEGALYFFFYKSDCTMLPSSNVAINNTRNPNRPYAWERSMMIVQDRPYVEQTKWLQVVEKIISWLSSCHDSLLFELTYLRYGAKQPVLDSCFELHIEKTTYYNLCDRLISIVVVAALSSLLLPNDLDALLSGCI